MTDKKKGAKRPNDRTILINFVLDKSGSMDVVREATISGFNEFLGDQRRERGRAYLTLTLFDTEFHHATRAVPLTEVPDLDYASYRPSGCTALYDAIGHTMRLTDDFVAENHPDQVLFVIMTDGMENASREFSRAQVFELIRQRQEAAGYEFVYLGANQDSYAVSRSVGIRAGRHLDYASSPEATLETMKRASANVAAYRRHGMKHAAMMFDPSFEAFAVDDGVPLAEKELRYIEDMRARGVDLEPEVLAKERDLRAKLDGSPDGGT